MAYPEEVQAALQAASDAADGDSNDTEIEALQDALEAALEYVPGHRTDALTFTLTITLGNDAMRYDGDIGRALIDLGNGLADPENSEFELTGAESGVIRDVNGNTVGSWAVQ